MRNRTPPTITHRQTPTGNTVPTTGAPRPQARRLDCVAIVDRIDDLEGTVCALDLLAAGLSDPDEKRGALHAVGRLRDDLAKLRTLARFGDDRLHPTSPVWSRAVRAADLLRAAQSETDNPTSLRLYGEADAIVADLIGPEPACPRDAGALALSLLSDVHAAETFDGATPKFFYRLRVGLDAIARVLTPTSHDERLVVETIAGHVTAPIEDGEVSPDHVNIAALRALLDDMTTVDAAAVTVGQVRDRLPHIDRLAAILGPFLPERQRDEIADRVAGLQVAPNG